MPPTPTLTVREVRAALRQRGDAGPGAPSNAHLGRVFHETFAGLVGGDPRLNASSALANVGANQDARRETLLRHAYDALVGPRIDRDQGLLQGQTVPLLTFWEAVRSLCDWLAGLPDLSGTAATEVPLELTVSDPAWTGPVRLTGVADAVLRPSPGRWCVVELKLGRTAPEADLAQALLYQLLLAGGGPPAGDLAVVNFGPERSERVFRAGEVEAARPALFRLIGRLAGVLRTEPAAAPPPPPDERQGARLIAALAEYDVRVKLDGPPVVGPAFVRYAVTLAQGVTLTAVQRRAQEIQIRLGLDAPPRIGIEGSRVVVDVQRPDRQPLPFAEIRAQLLGRTDPNFGSSLLPVGVGLDGKLTVADLSKPEHAHVLVAGTTGSGKSEWLRTALAGLILGNTPETLRLVLIDPKRNAFTWLKESPYLLRPIVFPPDTPASDALEALIDEMEARYRLLETSESGSIEELARKTGKVVPRIVCVCDEYAALINTDRRERQLLETQVSKLGAKARASGIHLILATQQPSRDTIKGAIDANMPARVGLLMGKDIESRMLLGQSGAETLLGRGDLLFKDIGEPVRLQAALLEDNERERLKDHGSLASRY